MELTLRELGGRLSNSYIAKFVIATAAYALVIVLSLTLVPTGGSGASLVWPVSAAGLALLWFWGWELWPAMVVAFFIVLLPRGVAPTLASTTAIANVAEALVALYILKNYVHFSPMLLRLRDTLGLALAAFASSLISASIITLGVYLFGSDASLNLGLWLEIWIGHSVSLLSFAPFFLRWLHRPFFTKTSHEVVEGVALFGIIFTLVTLLFWTPYDSVGGISLAYVLIVPLIWVALRTGPRGTSLALFILAIVTASGVIFGYGSLSSSANLSQALFGVQMIIGTLSLIFLLFTSITEERKEAVNELVGHVGKLEGALQKISSEDQAKTDFIAILAHELRNPLSPLLSGIEILKANEQGPDDVLQMMGAHLHSMAHLLDDLLDISRISQKKFKLQKESVEIRAIVSHSLEMVEPYYRDRDHSLTVRLPQEEVWLYGDAVRLTQIFVNLLNNAAKYTDKKGRIELTVTQEGTDLVGRVRDNGIGISADRLTKVFEPFGVGEGAERWPGGLRIGLSLARRMAEMHHGSVTAQSAGVGKGSEFTVRLPLPPTKHLPLQEPERPRTRKRFSKAALQESVEQRSGKRILLVDDNEPAARALGTLLEHHGHTVGLAYDAPEALAQCPVLRPEVAILDIGLPTMDGYALGRRIRADCGEDVVLIALTGYGQPTDKQKALEAGFHEHLIKPVSITEIQKILVNLSGS